MNDMASPEETPTSTPTATVFKYTTPDFGDKNKRVVMLAKTPNAICAVQAVAKGGENNLHHHKYFDGFWFVLKGAARFYTTDDEVVAELGEHEGILVPHHYPYWFESCGDVPLEIMQFESAGQPVADIRGDRVDLEPRKQELAVAEGSAAS
jgi:mannose-6-phosphate isomerase-like protein (cupin superfamily)